MSILWRPWVLCWERPQGARPGTESEPRARDPKWCGHRGPCCARWFAAAPSQPQPAVPTSLSFCSEARQPGEIIQVLYCPMCILSLLEHRIRPTLTWIERGAANSRRTARRRPCQLIAPNKNLIFLCKCSFEYIHNESGYSCIIDKVVMVVLTVSRHL